MYLKLHLCRYHQILHIYEDNYVFAQLTSFLDRNHFNYPVHKYGGISM